ncbi:hypothetical protein EYF80_021330 [Liparis tanakae]|uniref:Uncharacterized protein n=1 Tax=Liparis tanakae TaxID=230148 RepID=A0A4Z2HRE9_9TELE|nr:hypothetical protein EYF80_021330 [Liparis tanakae]
MQSGWLAPGLDLDGRQPGMTALTQSISLKKAWVLMASSQPWLTTQPRRLAGCFVAFTAVLIPSASNTDVRPLRIRYPLHEAPCSSLQETHRAFK